MPGLSGVDGASGSGVAGGGSKGVCGSIRWCTNMIESFLASWEERPVRTLEEE